MKCYYEELGIPRDSGDADIKTAYRKLALRWHPDKNLSCSEEAKERFQLIQQAYDVLSDPQERAWYDNHREQILRGKNSDYEENCLDLFQYFTVSCYKGYGDDPKGFFAVYREVFEKIAAEDAEFMDDEEDLKNIPSFGNSQSSYEEVVGPFYAYWSAYCTKKSYAWLCPYNIQEIKDRRVLREIEKEMKKIVQKAKKERNEEVRNLVSFVRKRDKRVQAYRQQLEERAALNRQKQEQNRLEQIRKRQRELEEMRQSHNHSFNDGYEEKIKELEQAYGDSSVDEGEESSDDETDGLEVAEEDYLDALYCVACQKAFKNDKAFANHETSKKHRDNVERIRQEMLEEDEVYKEDSGNEHDTDEATKGADDVTTNGENQVLEEEHLTDEEILELTEALSVEEEPTTKVKSKKSKKSKKANKSVATPVAETSSEHEDEIHKFIAKAQADTDSDAEDWNQAGKKTAKKSKNRKPAKIEVKAATEVKENVKPTIVPPSVAYSTTSGEEGAAPAHVCVTCKSVFPSKNKLFAHLKATNHGVYIPKHERTQPADEKPKKVKGKRK